MNENEPYCAHDEPSVPTMSGPADYTIRVRGRVTARDGERLGGLAVELPSDDVADPVTTLHGRLADQAALLGVLNSLYAWQLPVLSVEALSS
jgi:hypothetical protein